MSYKKRTWIQILIPLFILAAGGAIFASCGLDNSAQLTVVGAGS